VANRQPRDLARLVTEQAAEPDPIPLETAFGPTTTINMGILAWKDNGWQDLSPNRTKRSAKDRASSRWTNTPSIGGRHGRS
jgi:hypothetical protein